MKIRDMMSINAARILLGSTVREAADLFAFSNASDVVVVDAGNTFIGVLSEGDIMRAMLPELSEVMAAGGRLADSYDLFQEKGAALADQVIDPHVIRNPIVLAPDDEVHKAAALMAAKQIRRLPVVEGGKLIGTVSRADVCRAVISRRG
jgi:CBS domain-containing protein